MKKTKTEKQYSLMPITLKGVDVKNHTLDAVFSTNDEDRHGDVVLQNWDLSNFKANPVILNSHNYGDATDVIGRAENVEVVNGKLEGTIKFAVEENPKAKIIFDLYAGGFLNAFSVGFMAKEFASTGEIILSELLEVSAVSVPANAMALAKSKGIDVEKLYAKEEDNGGGDADGETTGETIEKDNGVVEGGDTEDSGSVEEEREEVIETVEEEEPEEVEELEERSAVKVISEVLSNISEAKKVETRSKNVRAKNIRLINKAIRNLLKIKKGYEN